jgi:hypothetical protein
MEKAFTVITEQYTQVVDEDDWRGWESYFVPFGDRVVVLHPCCTGVEVENLSQTEAKVWADEDAKEGVLSEQDAFPGKRVFVVLEKHHGRPGSGEVTTEEEVEVTADTAVTFTNPDGRSHWHVEVR